MKTTANKGISSVVKTLRVYKDFGIRFDTNIYTVPPRLVGKQVTLKADRRTVTVYYKEKQIATHNRSWEKNGGLICPPIVNRLKNLKKDC